MTITIQLPTYPIEREIPDSWNDCTPQLAMTLLQILQLDGPNLTAKRISAMQALLQVREEEWKAWELAHILDAGDVEQGRLQLASDIDALLEAIPWLLRKTDDGNYELNATLTKCPFPGINVAQTPSLTRHKRGSHSPLVPLYAPADGLANLTGEELAHAFTAYEAYTADPTDQNCNRLLAILWRKSKVQTPDQVEANWYGDRRQPFHEHNVEARANQIGDAVPPMAKNLMLFWFLSCRMAIIEQWPVVFKKADAVREEKPDFGWWGVYMAIIDDPLRIDDFARKPYSDLFTTIAWYESKAAEAELQQALASV